MSRNIELIENTQITPCPLCGNNTKFKAYSNQVAEDCCNVWVECECGYDPTAGKTEYRYEDVWGGTGDTMVLMALWCWNDIIKEE